MVNIFGYDYQEESMSLNKNKYFFLLLDLPYKNGTENIFFIRFLLNIFG